MSLLRGAVFATAATVALGGVAVQAQVDPFATAIEAARRQGQQPPAPPAPSVPAPAARPAIPPPRPMTGADPLAVLQGAAPQAPTASSSSAGRPPFRSFWPPPTPYTPPSQMSQAPTKVAPGTPDSASKKSYGPMTAEGKTAWTWSEYELQTLSWGNALPATGSAGAADQLKTNINNSPVRQKWITTFDGWIRATYQPKGAVTAAFREIFPNKTTQDHVPIYYGVSETLYAPVVKGGKVYRSPSPPFGWINILANQVQGQEASWPFNVPGERYIFTMAYDRDFRLTVPQTDTKLAAEVAAVRARIGINAPVYLTSQLVVVLITRDGRLPVRQMTIGESLAAAEAGIRRQMVREPGPQAMYAEQLAGVARMRAQHALDLNAPASSRNSQFFHYLFDSDQDVFARNTDGSSYPIYTFEPWAYEGAKSDTPQWLLISFPRSAASNSWGEQMAYEDMVNHFNYAYARDAIFNPQAVAGVAYTPRP